MTGSLWYSPMARKWLWQLSPWLRMRRVHRSIRPLVPANWMRVWQICARKRSLSGRVWHRPPAPARPPGAPRFLQLHPCPRAEAGVFTLTGEEQPPTGPLAYALPHDVAFLLHTAGTTSRPKIVPLTHTNICTAAHNLRLAFQLVESDRCLNVLPLFHVHALQTGLLTSLVAGGSIVCTPGFYAPQFFAWLAEVRPTWYTAVPAIHQAILARAPLHRDIIVQCPLRFIRSGSAVLPQQMLTELEAVFHTQVIETYGATEVSGHITCQPLPWRPRKTGAVGMAAGPEVAIMDARGTLLPAGETGEVVVRGASLMQGYDNDPVANQSAFTSGWFRTGDQGHVDADGYLFITGRLKEVINRGGEKIAPEEVDEVLMEHPAVAAAVTFAVPHAQLGEDIAAAVVLRQNAAATASDIRQFVDRRLAAFKVPSQVCIVEAIPKSSTGKLQRHGLAEQLGLTVSDWARPERSAISVTPRTPLQEVLAGLWAHVLDVEGVDIHDSFFELGGDSMLATQLLSRIREATHVEVSFVSFFETPTVEGMSRSIENATRVMPSMPAPPIQPVPRDGGLPLSYPQQRLWFLDQLGLSSYAYNLLQVTRLRGVLHPAALSQGLQAMTGRHEVLRTTFTHVAGQLLQVVGPVAPFSLPVVDLQGLPECEQEPQVCTLARTEAQRPFDLAQGALLRATLVRLAAEEHVLILTMHHIVTDGWSHGVFWRELGVL